MTEAWVPYALGIGIGLWVLFSIAIAMGWLFSGEFEKFRAEREAEESRHAVIWAEKWKTPWYQGLIDFRRAWGKDK